MNEPIKVKCESDKCGYEWYTKSNRKYVCCPNCHRNFRRVKDFVIVEQCGADGVQSKDKNTY